jgi:hypothetical protein
MNPADPFVDLVNYILSQPKFDTKIGCLRWAIADATLSRPGKSCR